VSEFDHGHGPLSYHVNNIQHTCRNDAVWATQSQTNALKKVTLRWTMKIK